MSEWNETCSQAPCNREKFDTTSPTPLERLEAWVREDANTRQAIVWYDGEYWRVSVTPYYMFQNAFGVAPTLDAAILAALAQAEER